MDGSLHDKIHERFAATERCATAPRRFRVVLLVEGGEGAAAATTKRGDSSYGATTRHMSVGG